ncbi:PREDICTED: probable WRKY transcription factor 27 [Camelina sativa]|uniref:Probable WRKY transcription factor 27 n=1 Tax=Camelina sativa TaxID=90675 RepID=A0ABM0US05_CAMSA|nr:PREDICTED: probable WRKY transcription factor 27 [Camelina sativa]
MSSVDWDLFAVVRSCSSSVSTATINTNSCVGHEDDGGNCKQQQDPPPPSPPLFTHIHGDRDSSSSCNELQDSCKPFLPVTTTTSWSPPPLLPPPPPIVSSSAPTALMKQEQVLLESQDQKPRLGVRVFPPSTSPSVFVFRGQRDQLLQQQSQPPLRSRKRKNQQKRTICHVTQENLSSDMWAWRKYGQKPIKGSPYPRNYYRCSSSKGCLARKQVERSNLDPNIFIVTYTGEHTHPRPTHRNSLAGSTRNKSQPVNPIPKPDSSGQTVLGSNTVKEEIHLSPTTPLKGNDDVQGTNGDEDMISQEVNMEDEEEDVEEEDDEDVGEDDDMDDLLIPNLAVRDRDDLFFAGNFSSWSAGSAGGGGG